MIAIRKEQELIYTIEEEPKKSRRRFVETYVDYFGVTVRDLGDGVRWIPCMRLSKRSPFLVDGLRWISFYIFALSSVINLNFK